MKLASFDIFDTTLIRKCGRPENVFFLMAKYMFPDNEAFQTDFFMWRCQAEAKAIGSLNKRNLIIDEIYNGFDQLGLGGYTKSETIKIEKQLESSQLTSNYEIKEKIAEKRSEGYTICFISDMYLDAVFLKEILMREDCASKEDKVFVSCCYDKTKAQGDLYDVVRSEFADIEEWIHFGDNKYSDYKRSKRKGCKAVLVDTTYSKCELEVEKESQSFPYGNIMSVLVGFQRCARLHLSVPSDDDMCNASDFVASSYIPYMHYVFENASKNGIKRLYFVSRDSHILYELADLFKVEYPDVDCRYLFVSRKSLSLSCLNDISKECLGYIFCGSATIIGLEVKAILKTLQLTDLKIDVPFNAIDSKEKEDAFVKALLLHKNEIESRKRKKDILLNSYLSQEGVFDDENMALVDVGWFGSTRLMINSLRRKRGLSNIQSFYFGCRKDVLNSSFGSYFSFMPATFVTSDLTVLIEAYCSMSSFQTTIGYLQNNNIVQPILAESNDNKIVKDLFRKNVSICRYICQYIKDVSYTNFSVVFGLWGISFLQLFNKKPSAIHYSTFTKISGVDKDNVISHISIIEFLTLFFHGRKFKKTQCMLENSIYYSYGIRWKREWTAHNFLKSFYVFLLKRL